MPAVTVQRGLGQGLRTAGPWRLETSVRFRGCTRRAFLPAWLAHLSPSHPHCFLSARANLVLELQEVTFTLPWREREVHVVQASSGGCSGAWLVTAQLWVLFRASPASTSPGLTSFLQLEIQGGETKARRREGVERLPL